MNCHATKTWKKIQSILLSERSQPEKVTLNDSNYMTFLKRKNCGDTKKTSSSYSFRKQESTGRTQIMFRTVKLHCTKQ
jgi:hypothetical protein